MADGVASDRFFQVLSSILNVGRESLSPQSSRDSLDEWDSIKHMYVVLALEEEFRIEFSDDEIANLVAYVASPLSSATNGAALRVDGGVIPTIG